MIAYEKKAINLSIIIQERIKNNYDPLAFGTNRDYIYYDFFNE